MTWPIMFLFCCISLRFLFAVIDFERGRPRLRQNQPKGIDSHKNIKETTNMIFSLRCNMCGQMCDLPFEMESRMQDASTKRLFEQGASSQGRLAGRNPSAFCAAGASAGPEHSHRALVKTHVADSNLLCLWFQQQPES